MSVKTELFQLAEKMNANPVHIENEKDRVFQVNLNESGTVQIILMGGKVDVVDGALQEPGVTLSMSDKNFSKLLKDDLNTAVAFMTGGLKIEGSLGLALKLQEIVKKYK
ncbi:SCP2 sterol-binding domain-containing protein [Bacillus sp. JJ1773]|uniref:SCP2 sterol-binding domain-containing protein n=1 Tax=Bacillus sp. JJ1773 TaxID=3122965 RepID=UPI003000F430